MHNEPRRSIPAALATSAVGSPVVTPPRDGTGDRRYLKPEMIDEQFAHHPPSHPIVGDVHALIRAELRRLAHWFNEILPEGPLKTTAINQGLLRTMWAANAAVAVGQDPAWVNQVSQHVHYYDQEPVASFEAEQRELARLGQFFLREQPDLISQGSVVDNTLRLLREYAAVLAGAETASPTGRPWQEPVPAEEAAEAVFQTLGQAALAWDQIPGAYRGEIAAAIGRDLLVKLGYEIPEMYRGTGGREAIAQAVGVAKEAPLRGDVLHSLTDRAYTVYASQLASTVLAPPQWPGLDEAAQRAWLAAVGTTVEAYRAMVRILVIPPDMEIGVAARPTLEPRFVLGPVEEEPAGEPG